MPNGPSLTYNGHAYQYISGDVSYTLAKQNASWSSYSGLSGHLLTINSAGEQAFIVNNANSLGLTQSGFLWLGLENRAGTTGSWVNGEAFLYSNWAPTSFTGADFETRVDAALVGTNTGAGRQIGDWIAWGAPGQSASYIIEYENYAPSITSSASVSTPENVSATSTIYTATATDTIGTTLTYGLAGGADANLFNINSSTGAVTFKALPDFERPKDAGTNNVYDITIRASDGLLFAENDAAITVTDVPENASLHGMSYFWKADSTGKHVLLKDVNINALGGSQPAEGPNAPIQLKINSWDASGRLTLDIIAHSTAGFDSYQANISFGGAQNASFVSKLTSGLNEQATSANGISIAGIGITGTVGGDLTIGTLTLETGSSTSARFGVEAGSLVAPDLHEARLCAEFRRRRLTQAGACSGAVLRLAHGWLQSYLPP